MLNNWKDYNRRQALRRILPEQATPESLYAPRPAKSEDAIEAEIEAMAAEENRVIDRANADIAQAFAAAAITTTRRAA
jgi:hypothetical protein